MNKVTTINITFNSGVKQYQYLLQGNNNITIGTTLKAITGVTKFGPQVQNITVQAINILDNLPYIVTSGLKILPDNTVQLFKLSYDQISKLRCLNPAPITPVAPVKPIKNIIKKKTVVKPCLYTAYYSEWKVAIRSYDQTKKDICFDLNNQRTPSRKTIEFLLERSDFLIKLLTKFDCSKIFYQTRVITLAELNADKEWIKNIINK